MYMIMVAMPLSTVTNTYIKLVAECIVLQKQWAEDMLKIIAQRNNKNKLLITCQTYFDKPLSILFIRDVHHECPPAEATSSAIMKLKCQANIIKLKYHRQS